jgi:P27 family predicted phage terminase small subunit
MNQRGRKSAAERAANVVSITGKQRRLRPPDHLSGAEREIFADLVGACDPEAFRPTDLPLLSSYATAIAQERDAVAHLQREGYVIAGRPSPWIIIKEKAHREMVALSMRLRLSPQGRNHRKEIKPDNLSAYERMRLEGDDEDDDGGSDAQ